MEEIYKTIDGYENLYEISNLGNVKNIKTKKIIKNILSNIGYYRVGLCKDGKCKLKLVHVLIAQAFITNPLNKPTVDHIDQIKTNNNLNNLRWVTRSENGMNSDIQSNNISGHRGVSYNIRDKRWTAQLKKNENISMNNSYKLF